MSPPTSQTTNLESPAEIRLGRINELGRRISTEKRTSERSIAGEKPTYEELSWPDGE